MFAATHLIGFGAGGDIPWIDIAAAMWTQGNTGSFTLGTGTVSCSTADKTIITANSLVALNQDFDFRFTVGAISTQNGPKCGFSPNGTSSGGSLPTTTDPIVYACNGGAGGDVGWSHDNQNPDGSAKSAGWMASHIIQISRRGSTFYGLIDGVLDHTFTEVTGGDAGNLFILSAGGTTSFALTGVQYRVGPGLPAIA